MQREEEADSISRPASILLALAAGVLAFGTGVLVALFVPPGQSNWSGLALLPLWLLVEAMLGLLVVLGSIPRKPDKMSIIVVVLAGFYGGALLVPVITA